MLPCRTPSSACDEVLFVFDMAALSSCQLTHAQHKAHRTQITAYRVERNPRITQSRTSESRSTRKCAGNTGGWRPCMMVFPCSNSYGYARVRASCTARRVHAGMLAKPTDRGKVKEAQDFD
mmetsp:Transcript_799/g.1124  ORF Transcript_799/g.1124 Transcript_799/m.1124 type:complete len:121 (+) Transcript_799:125-487(+)